MSGHEATASTKKPANELQLAAGASHPSDQEQEGLRTVNQTTIETAATIADPGAATPEQRADDDLFEAWRAANDAWREQFHPAILAASPTWAVDVSTEAIRYDVDGTMLPKPYIRVIFSSQDYLDEKIGMGSIAQNADYDPETGTLDFDGDPYIDLYLSNGRAWSVNDLVQLAAGIRKLAAVANADSTNHYVEKSAILAGIVNGTPARAICGETFVPEAIEGGKASDVAAPICSACAAIFDGMPA